MVTMEGCVNVVGVAGRYLGLEEPVKLIRGWVLLLRCRCLFLEPTPGDFDRRLPAAHVWAVDVARSYKPGASA